MTDPVPVLAFSHVCIRVSDIERSLGFYRDALGLEVIFDHELGGEGIAAAAGQAGAHGRMVGCRVPGGVTIELLCFAHGAGGARGGRASTGYTNLALSVADLEEAREGLVARGLSPGPPIAVAGVRMFFVADPDGTPIEIIAFPGGATTSASHNGA